MPTSRRQVEFFLIALTIWSGTAYADASFSMRCVNPEFTASFDSPGNSGQMITPLVQFNINQPAAQNSTIFVNANNQGICEVTIESAHVFTGGGSSILEREEQESRPDFTSGERPPFSSVRATRLGNKVIRFAVSKTYAHPSWKSSATWRFTADYRRMD